MKTTLFLIIFSLSGAVQAGIKKYSLHFRHAGQHLEVPVSTDSFESAIEKAAEKCFEFFTERKPSSVKLSHDEKLDVVDVCANPRTK